MLCACSHSLASCTCSGTFESVYIYCTCMFIIQFLMNRVRYYSGIGNTIANRKHLHVTLLTVLSVAHACSIIIVSRDHV